MIPLRHLLPLIAGALLLAGAGPAFAADPWEFPTEAKRASAEAEFQRHSPMRGYEKAQELIKKGGPKAYEDAIRRLRWCISKQPESGLHRDKIRRWKKIEYYPYYHLALIFAWQGDWNSSLRSIQREDNTAIANSAFSVGYQRFMEDLNKVLARAQLAHMVGELEQWRAQGVPLSIDAAHDQTLATAREQASALAAKPAGPWRGGHDEEPAALAQEVGKALMTIYRLELGSRKRALEELTAPPWPTLLGASSPVPSPASCDYTGNDLKHARDLLVRCAELTHGVLRLAATKACEQAADQAPAWCATTSVPAWREIAGLVKQPAAATAANRPPTQKADSPKKKPPPKRKSKPRPAPVETAAPEPTEAASDSSIDSATGPDATQEIVGDQGPQVGPPEAAPKTPVDPLPLLRRTMQTLEQGGLDRAIEQLREVDSDGVFPREGQPAALCRLTFAYALHLKLAAFPQNPKEDAGRQAREFLEREIDQQLRAARQLAPDFVVPAGLFPGFESLHSGS